MTDPRPQRLARLLGGRMLGLAPGHSVVVEAPPVAAPLVEALAAYAGTQGAHVAWLAIGGGYQRAVLGSSTTDEIAAANSAPIAHADCISPIAFPRCSAGHVSATSTEPHDHSPAMPSPTSNRHAKSCHGACAVASPAVATE